MSTASDAPSTDQPAFSRRRFLKLGAAPVAAGLVASFGLHPPGEVNAATSVQDAAAERGSRYLIVNADDLGMAPGINRGIFQAHAYGILTSASLLVEGAAAEDAVGRLAEFPRLSVGLHVDLTSGYPATIPWTDLPALSREIERQLTVFTHLTGSAPTHIDSHHHTHRRFNVARAFLDVSERYHLPLRGLSPVVYLGGFYGQWPEGKTDAKRISAEALVSLISSVGPGLTEIGCHPGYFDPGFDDVYGRERELELSALVDPRVRRAAERRGIRLVSYMNNAMLASSMVRVGAR
jgi:predicted glycoside hydrolase/deacetylase ChbG (UPF0249 family)